MADFYHHCEKLHLQTKLTKASAFFRGHDLMVDHHTVSINYHHGRMESKNHLDL